MTICIAAICDEGSKAVLATDSMITHEWLSVEFEHPTRKMTKLSDCCAALTAGDALAHTELFNAVQDEIIKLRSPSISETVERIKECYQRIREREIKETILKPRGFKNFDDFYQAQKSILPDIAFSIQNKIDEYDYGLEIIVTGVDESKASIYGIFNPGTSKCFNAVGFHAIGSGLPHALNALIARECHPGIPLWEAILIVYEAKKMAEKAPGVGARITNMSIMTKDGLTEFPEEIFEDLNKIYKNWVKDESNISCQVSNLLKEKKSSQNEANAKK